MNIFCGRLVGPTKLDSVGELVCCSNDTLLITPTHTPNSNRFPLILNNVPTHPLLSNNPGPEKLLNIRGGK